MPLLGATGGGSAKGFGALANLGYFIRNSLRFRLSNSAYLSRTPASAGNRRTYTWSAWVKRGALNGGGTDMSLFNAGTTSPNYDGFRIKSDTISFYQGGAVSVNLESTQVFRDSSAWYHLVLAVDTTQATAANRVKIYVNGNQVTAFGTANYPSLNAEAAINNNLVHNIAAQYANTSSSAFFDGYMGEINFIDGQALTPSSFGKTDAVTDQWIPKKFAGTYGTNGFYLKFADASAATAAAIGKDSSPNGNNWTPNNISVTAGVTYDAMIDSPTLSATASNYCVLNRVAPYGSSLTLSEGNLKSACAGAYWASLPGTFLIPSTGKWYWEVKATTATNMPIDSNIAIGITKNISSQYNTGQDQWPGYTADSYGMTNDVSSMYKWTNATPTAYGASYTINDVIGVGLDMDAGTLTYYKNGVSQGVAFSGLTGNFVPSLGVNNTGTSAAINFGHRPFAYTPPAGFKSLNTFNLP